MSAPASATATGAARKRPLLPPDFVRTVLKGHSLLGLALATAIYLVCLSGTLAVFLHEFQRWENPQAPRIEAIAPEALQRGFEESVARAGTGLEHVFISLPTPELPWLLLQTDADGPDRKWVADEAGRIVASGATPWTDFLVNLHIYLHLPQTLGLFVVGLTGVALLSSLISGLLAHPRIFRDAFHLRIGGNERLQEADLHNRIGVWGLPFHIVVSLSGAFLGLTTLIVGVLGMAMFQGDTDRIYDLFIPPHPVDDPRAAPLPDLAPMHARINELAPYGTVEYIIVEHPLEQGAAALFNVDDGSARLTNTDAYAFDRSGDEPYHIARASDGNLGTAVLGSLAPLHFGWFGGGIIRIAYGLLGLGITYVAANGVLIYFARRRAKGRPMPVWERLWSAVIWGQPVALAAALAAVVFAGLAGAAAAASLPLLVWGAASLVAFPVALRLGTTAFGKLARATSGALLIAASLTQIVTAGTGADPIAWAVSLVLIATGAVLVRRAVR